jgi:hypothetical protein
VQIPLSRGKSAVGRTERRRETYAEGCRTGEFIASPVHGVRGAALGGASAAVNWFRSLDYAERLDFGPLLHVGRGHGRDAISYGFEGREEQE